MKKGWAAAAVVIIFILIMLGISFGQFNIFEEFVVSPSAPEFTVQDANGTIFTLGDHKGEVVVLQFMSIPGCGDNPAPTDEDIAEFKELRTVYDKYCLSSSTENVTIATIIQHSQCCKLNLTSESYKDIAWFVATEREPYPTIHKYGDYIKTEMIIVQGYTVPKMNPKIIIVDKDQKIASVSNYSSADSLSSKIDSVLEGGGTEQIPIFSITQVPLSMYLGMFVLGIITCAAPCCLALFVATISYIVSVSIKKTDTDDKSLKISTKRGATIGGIFTIGMALVFFLIGVLVMYLNTFIQKGIMADSLIAITGLILILFGLDNIGAFNRIKKYRRMKKEIKKDKIETPSTEKGIIERLRLSGLKISKHRILIGTFLLGMLFGIAWIPCALSLIFPVILLLMTQKLSILTGGLLLFAYGLGHGVPFIPLASATSALRAKLTEKMVKTGKILIIVFGIIVIILGVLMILNFFGFDFGLGW
jgi:cytochrome c-type biogenesis protein